MFAQRTSAIVCGYIEVVKWLTEVVLKWETGI